MFTTPAEGYAGTAAQEAHSPAQLNQIATSKAVSDLDLNSCLQGLVDSCHETSAESLMEGAGLPCRWSCRATRRIEAHNHKPSSLCKALTQRLQLGQQDSFPLKCPASKAARPAAAPQPFSPRAAVWTASRSPPCSKLWSPGTCQSQYDRLPGATDEMCSCLAVTICWCRCRVAACQATVSLPHKEVQRGPAWIRSQAHMGHMEVQVGYAGP